MCGHLSSSMIRELRDLGGHRGVLWSCLVVQDGAMLRWDGELVSPGRCELF